MLDEEGAECICQDSHMVRGGARESARMGEDQPRVPLPGSRDVLVQRGEVLDVLGDNRPLVGRRGPQQVLVGHSDQLCTLLDGDGVVSPVSQPGRDPRGVHLVEEEPHPDSSLRSFSQVANSRSAMSWLRAIRASISSVNSA